MDKQIAQMTDHIILCGAGNTGRAIADEFLKTERAFVVIEKNPEQIAHLRQIGDIPYVQDDATEDLTLQAAGIERARGLVTSLAEDKDNVFVVLSARALNPKLRIVARLIELSNAEKLRKAGADETVSANMIGGMRLASLMIRPSVVSFLDAMLRVTGPALRMEEIYVGHGSPLSGKTLGEADLGRRTGLLVVAIKPKDGGYQFNPGGQTRLNDGDVLIVMGTQQQLANAAAQIAS